MALLDSFVLKELRICTEAFPIIFRLLDLHRCNVEGMPWHLHDLFPPF